MHRLIFFWPFLTLNDRGFGETVLGLANIDLHVSGFGEAVLGLARETLSGFDTSLCQTR